MANFCPDIENICVSRGDSPVIPIRVTNPDTSAVIDITGFSFVLIVSLYRPFDTLANEVFRVTIPSLADGSSGVVQFQPSTSQTDRSPGDYYYGIEMTTTTPSVRRILAGEFEIRQV